MARLILCLFLFSCSALAAAENFGIAFVHGTNDHRLDAETEYWKPEFTHNLAQALPNHGNKLVVRCDFSNYMWDEGAAGCLAEQLEQFINEKQITKLIIYTHSNGGNVIRWLLSHPTYDSRFMHVAKTIHEVIATAPSSGGTVLADDAVNGDQYEAGLGWLLGYQNHAVKQQRLSDMAVYNSEVLLGTKGRPNLPVPFRVVVGTDVLASPFNAHSYCNGFFLNAALRITKVYLDDCDDGYLDCKSQMLAGTLWFYDWQKTIDKAPLNHNQSRHSCHGLDEILRNDLYAQGVPR